MNFPSPNLIVNSNYGPIIVNINDTVITKHILTYGYWAIDDLRVIRQLLDFLLTKKSSLVFYDVGANIGTHSLALAKLYGDRVAIRAFEAQREVFNMLCGTLAINSIANVYTYNMAVSDLSDEVLQLPVPDYRKENNFGGLEIINPLRSDNQSMSISRHEEIKTIRVSDFNEDVDFIKLDIEGMEDKALVGAEPVLERCQPILFIEILKTNIDSLTNTLRRHSYVGFRKNADLIAIPLKYQIQIEGLQRVF